ncbi:MAG: hypothetical protein Q8L13_18145 [Bradyrhizobium sp.]|uniref:hypothetical protein n=1 Tax=Bradyrhizobium sp. TaxID=376 RepID=UPI00272FE047|nr:hypothetical protein [Bradyrhizobium sp.]MDP1868243.1 hypothetical protein [Bradyrhizobium sp.]
MLAHSSIVVIEARMPGTRAMKIICSILCLLVLASNLWTMRNWTERTGVYDDICYLRQAHLFQRFGLGGFDTNITRDDDQYFATLAREIGYPAWDDQARAPCHTPIGDKHVIQYPPGTGLALSFFPAGFQRVPLYAVANFVIFLVATLAIWSARSRRATAGAGVIGMAAIYFMVNPSKASSSMAPTMIVCAVVGYLTAILANAAERSRRLTAAVLIGLLLGLAVSFRLPNLFLSAGYFIVLLGIAIRSKASRDIWRFSAFGAAYLLGLMPTLIANAINAGNVLATTYGAVDATPPDFSLSIAREYFTDMQGALILLTATWTIVALASNVQKTAASIVAINLAPNLAFFLTHPISTPYYLMPLAMQCLWTLLFSYLNDPRHENGGPRDVAIGTKAAKNH